MVRPVTAEQQPIRTPDQRLRVFVSSTLGELANERGAARRAIEALHLTPVMFEMGARPHPARALYRAYLDQSHVFLGIYWERYGWVAPAESVSGLEDEYLLSGSLPRLVYLKDPAPERESRLRELIDRIQADDTVAYKRFEDVEEIERLITEDLAVMLSERFLEPDADALPASTAWGVRLPQPASPIVGRDAELSELTDVLVDDDVRLVTLVGPGGIGKTRLGLELARSVAPRFVDGAVMVRLDGTRADEDVLPAIAAAMGVTIEATARPDAVLTSAIGRRRVLLLLDNFEHVLGAAAGVGGLLEQCPNLTVLVTSRAPVGLRAEHEYHVPPLAVPVGNEEAGVRTAAVELFVERARSVRDDFVLDDDNRDAVFELCRRLEGIPLALELAAARVRMLVPAELVTRLDERLHILGVRGPGVPERQRTLSATIEWSFDLLHPDQRALFARLSVFEEGFTLEQAEQVCGSNIDVLDALSGLVEHSLVAPWATDAPEPRFGMFNMIRAFARDQLLESGEGQAVADHHLDFFADLAVAGAGGLQSTDFHSWMPRILPEWGNMRSAWLHAIDTGAGHRAVDLARCAFVCMWVLGRLRELAPLIDATLATDDALDDGDRGRLLLGGALVAYAAGDYESCRHYLADFEDLRDAVADDSLAGAAALYRAFLAVDQWDMVEFERSLTEAETLLRAADDRWTLGFCPGTRGVLSYIIGDFETASALESEAFALGVESGNDVLAVQAAVFLVMVTLAAGDTDGARYLAGRTLTYVERYPYWEATAYAYEAIANLAAADGAVEAAARLIGAADTLRSTISSSVWPLVRSMRDQIVGRVREAISADRYEQLHEEGGELGPPRVLAIAREVLG